MNQEIFGPPSLFYPDRSASVRRYATGTYIVYALIIMGQGVILHCKLGKADGLLSPCFLVPFCISLLVLALTFARHLRGVIGLLVSLHLFFGLMFFVLAAITLCDWDRSEHVRPMDLMWLVIFVNFNVVIPLAVFIAYLVKSKYRGVQRRNELAWNEWRQNRQDHLPLEERLRLRRRK